MAERAAPRSGGKAKLRRLPVVAAMAVAGTVLVGGSIAGAAGRPAASPAIRPVITSAFSHRALAPQSVPDVAGEPVPFGTARYFGSIARKDHVSQVIGMAVSPGGRGYWLATAHGGVFTFGHAKFHGALDAPGKDPIVAIVATRDGRGYWLVDSAGVVFNFGDAKLRPALKGRPVEHSVVAMAATPDDRGYWLAAADGDVFAYGDAHVYGSATGDHPDQRIVAMAATSNGRGYWLVASDGAVFPYGDAHLHGSATGDHVDHIVAIATTPDGHGYWLVASGGGVFTFGNAHFYGSVPSAVGNNPIVAVAAAPDGRGYWLLPTSAGPFGLPPPGEGFLAGHATAIGDSVMLDAQPDLVADIPGIDVEAQVSRQWDEGVALAQQLKSEGRLGAVVIIDLGTNGPVTPEQFTMMMDVLAGASRVVFVTVHLPPSYSWWQSVNDTLRQGVAKYPRDRLADFNRLADENPQWFGPDGIHMPIGGTGAQAMAKLIKSQT